MKVLDSSLTDITGSNVITIATCWQVTSIRTGEVKRFTSHDRSLPIGNVVFSAVNSFTPGQVTTTMSLAVDNISLNGFLSVTGITKRDVLAGVWDFAEVKIFVVNYLNPVIDAGKIRAGWIGQIQMVNQSFEAEVRGDN